MTVKLRAEYFWADRWMLSSARQLPLEMRGLYREMLTAAWACGASLPNDPDAIKRLVACTDDEWKRCWPTVRRWWHVREADARLVNDTQVEVFTKSEQSYERSRKAAKTRWDRQAKAPLNNAHRITHRDTHAETHGDAQPDTHRDAQSDQHMHSGSGSGSGSGTGPTTTKRARARKRR